MKIQTILEMFDLMMVDIDILGIEKTVERDRLSYSFHDNKSSLTGARTYHVDIALSSVKREITNNDYIDNNGPVSPNDVKLMSSAKSGYVDLIADGRVTPTNAGNQKFVYTRLLASMVDAITKNDLKLIAFTPLNGKMGLIYISMAKRLMRNNALPKFIALSETMYISDELFHSFSENTQLMIKDRYQHDINKVKAQLKKQVGDNNVAGRIRKYIDTNLVGRTCDFGEIVGRIVSRSVTRYKIDFTIDIGEQYKEIEMAPEEVMKIRIVNN